MKKGIIKKLMAITMATSLSLGFMACGANESKESGSGEAVAEKTIVEEIKESGKLVLGTSADYPPYEFHADINGKDTIVGFDIEIAKEVAKDLGVELVLQDMKFDSLVAALQSGTVDMVISGMNPTPERAEAVDFSDIYYKAEHGILIRAEDKDKFKTKDDFNGKNVGAQKGSIQEDLANTQVEGSVVKGLGKVPDLIMELISGNSDAVVMEIPVADANAGANDKLFVIQEPGFELDETEQGNSVAMPKDSPELVEIVNKTIERLVSEGKIEQYIVEANELMEKTVAE